MDLAFLEYPFMQRALIAGGATGLICAVVGVFVVLRGIAFAGEGISHAAFAGIALGLLLGTPPLLTALVFCTFGAMLIAYVSGRGGIREDSGSGIFFSASIACGVLLLTFTQASAGDIVSYLFGNLLLISNEDLFFSLSLAGLALAVIMLLYKELMTLVFDEEVAMMLGLPVRAFTYLLFALLAVTVVASLRVVGIILVSSLLVTPAATALQIARDFDKVMVLAAFLGVAVVECGLVLSYYLDTPPGATIALSSTACFLVSLAGKKRKGFRGASGRSLGGS
jgi:ABC-type Mn2+/Zn2+ transport system permease subunit